MPPPSEALGHLGGWVLASSAQRAVAVPVLPPSGAICPADVEVMAEWGHVRRGYRLDEMDALFGRDHDARATFISPVTVIAHDLSFSNLPQRVRRWRSPHRAGDVAGGVAPSPRSSGNRDRGGVAIRQRLTRFGNGRAPERLEPPLGRAPSPAGRGPPPARRSDVARRDRGPPEARPPDLADHRPWPHGGGAGWPNLSGRPARRARRASGATSPTRTTGLGP